MPHRKDRLPAIVNLQNLPSLILNAGDDAVKCFLEFFTANIRNKNTRQAYARAVGQFLYWCEERGIGLYGIQPVTVAAYVEAHGGAPQSVKQHLAAIKQFFDYLVIGQIVPTNPAASVRGPKHIVKKGKTPVLSAKETRKLIDSIDCNTLIGLRDRALIGLMVYSFARISAVLGMNVRDYYLKGGRRWIRLHEKGGKFHEVPVHHVAQEYLDEYLEACGLGEEKKAALFQTFQGNSPTLSGTRLQRAEAFLMIKRRALAASLPSSTCCHTFRATGITAYLLNGGTVETAQEVAAHESPRTTKLYDRRREQINLEEIERIRI